jgi:phage terminase small subunit
VSDSAPKRRQKPKRPELSICEVRFAELYAAGGTTASQAHRDAGFPPRPADNVHTMAWRLLRKPAVQKLIHDLRQEALDAARVTVNRLAQALSRIAFADRGDLFDAQGCLLPFAEWPADVAATVEGIDTEELFALVGEPGQKERQLVGRARKVRTARRVEAIKLLMQWRGMVRDAEVAALDRELQRLRELLEQVKGGRA